MRRPDRAHTTKNFKRQEDISLITSPFHSKTTTPDISQSIGTKLSLLIVIFITTHVRSKRQFTYTLITSIETVELKFHGCSRQRTAKGTNQRNSEETPQTTLQTLEIERRHLLPISHFFALRIEQALLTRVISHFFFKCWFQWRGGHGKNFSRLIQRDSLRLKLKVLLVV